MVSRLAFSKFCGIRKFTYKSVGLAYVVAERVAFYVDLEFGVLEKTAKYVDL